MRLFAGEWVESVLRRLGMSEDEPIESRVVTRRILAAQKKTETQSLSDISADSAEEWLHPRLGRQE